MGCRYEHHSPIPPEVFRAELIRRVKAENGDLAHWRVAEGRSADWKGRIKLTWRGERFTLSFREDIKSDGGYAGADRFAGKRGGRAFAGRSVYAGYGTRRLWRFGNPFRGTLMAAPDGGTILRGRFTMPWAGRIFAGGMLLLCLVIGLWRNEPLALLVGGLCLLQLVRGELRANRCPDAEGILWLLGMPAEE